MAKYKDSVPTDPNTARDFAARGRGRASRGDYDGAIADYGEALRIDPEYAMIRYNRGVLWDEVGEYDKAIADYGEAVRIDPAYADAYCNRGVAWGKKGEYEKALADFDEALRIAPDDVLIRYNRGNTLARMGRYGEALADFDGAIRTVPDQPAFHNARAWLLATVRDDAIRDGRQAVESATRACEATDWDSPNELDTLAAALAEVGDFATAIKRLEKAVALLDKRDGARRSEYRDRLRLYRAGRPYRPG